jgi:hypothetical protein
VCSEVPPSGRWSGSRQQARPAGRSSRPCQQDLLYRESRDQVPEPDALTLRPCEPKTSSAPRDQVISADRAVGASLSSDAVRLKIDRFGPRAARGTLEPPPVRDKNGLRRLRTVTAQES